MFQSTVVVEFSGRTACSGFAKQAIAVWSKIAGCDITLWPSFFENQEIICKICNICEVERRPLTYYHIITACDSLFWQTCTHDVSWGEVVPTIQFPGEWLIFFPLGLLHFNAVNVRNAERNENGAVKVAPGQCIHLHLHTYSVNHI